MKEAAEGKIIIHLNKEGVYDVIDDGGKVVTIRGRSVEMWHVDCPLYAGVDPDLTCGKTFNTEGFAFLRAIRRIKNIAITAGLTIVVVAGSARLEKIYKKIALRYGGVRYTVDYGLGDGQEPIFVFREGGRNDIF